MWQSNSVQEGSKKAIISAFVANLGIAIAKFAGFLLTSSAGLLAEAFHSLADTGNQGLLLLGSKKGRRRPTEHHQFGYGRERYFWSFIVALVLFSLGGLFAIFEGINKYRHPHETENLIIAIVILSFAVALESYSLATAMRESRKIRGASVSTWKFIRQAKQPELPVVLLEDIAAETGLVMALFGVVMAHLTGNPKWDAATSIGIGVLLVVVAAILAIEMKSLLIGESVSDADEDSIRNALISHPHVLRIIHLRTEHHGPEEITVAAKVEFTHSLDMQGLATAIDEAEVKVRSVLPSVKLIFIEPDIFQTK